MALRDKITAQSWLEDMGFVLGVFCRGEPTEISIGHVDDYLAHRYQSELCPAAGASLQAAYNWIRKNWEFLGEVGLRTSSHGGQGAVYNCVLFALHNFVFREPSLNRWASIPDIDPREVVSEAQKFIDAEKAAEQNDTEQRR